MLDLNVECKNLWINIWSTHQERGATLSSLEYRTAICLTFQGGEEQPRSWDYLLLELMSLFKGIL